MSGPHFQPESEWPVNPDDVHQVSSEDPEVREAAVVNAVQAREEVDAVTTCYPNSVTDVGTLALVQP